MTWWHKTYRAGLHIPVGWFTGLCLDVGAIWGVLFFVGFFAYELCEDWSLRDGAYLDIYGWLIGFAIMAGWKWLHTLS